MDIIFIAVVFVLTAYLYKKDDGLNTIKNFKEYLKERLK